MIMDKNLMFSADQDIKAISGSSTAVASTNTAIVGKADFGYKGMFLVVKLKEALLAAKTNGGADGLTIKVEACDNSAFSSNVVTLAEKQMSIDSAMAEGTDLAKFLLRDCQGLKYIRVTYKGDGTYVKNDSQTTLKVDTFLVIDNPTE